MKSPCCLFLVVGVPSLLIILFSKQCACEILTSVVDLEKLHYAEYFLSTAIEGYIQAEKKRLKALVGIAKDFKDHSTEVLANPQKNLGNMVSAFRTVKRFTVDWQEILNSFIRSNALSQVFLDEIEKVSLEFPSDEDLITAAANIIRVQDTYDLDPATIASGHVEATDGFNVDECFELGKVAYDEGDYHHGILWLEYALNLSRQETGTSWSKKGQLYDYLNYAHFQNKNIHRAVELVEEWLDFEPTSERAVQNLEHYRTLQSKKGDLGDVPIEIGSASNNGNRPRDEWQSGQTYRNYEALCRGDGLPNTHIKKSKLRCHYQYYHPMFAIRPLKEEELSLDPIIKLYHDVLLGSEMEKIKELSTPLLHRSGVFKTEDHSNLNQRHRVSKTAWVTDDKHSIIKTLSERASAITGLSVQTVEELQVVNYGIGGHYEPHYDYSRAGEETGFVGGHGNRIATLICYLNVVEAGGRTVFPTIGVAVTPEVGACAVWFNLKKNGNPDERTIHAGCPVLTGTKWIGTKWFHEIGNEFNRKCDTDPFG